MLLFHELFHYVILLPLLLNTRLQFLPHQLHFLLPMIAFEFLFLFKVFHNIRGAPSALFFCVDSRGFTFRVSFSWSDSNVQWRLPCAPLPRFFAPFLCSLPWSIFHRVTSPCQLFLQELGLVRTPRTKCQRHFPLAYFCFLLSDKQSQPVSY